MSQRFHKLEERRVRKLRLSAANENELRRGVDLIKDAFHVISLPGLIDSRLLIIRTLPVGRFSVNRGSAFLATVIERKLIELSSRAVRADHPNAASYPAVYFLDEMEPYIVLAARIARGDDTSAWFWPLAAKGWRPGMSRNDAFRAILYRVAVAETGVIGVARLVRELLERNLIDQLLSTLRTDDAAQLMRTSGWPKIIQPAVSSKKQAFENEVPALDLEVSWAALDTLSRWLRRWGATDGRSIWLAAILLIEKKPGRLLDRQLMSRAVRLVDIANTGISKSSAFPNPRRASTPSQEGSESSVGLSLSSSSPAAFDNLASAGAGKHAPTANIDAALNETRRRAGSSSSTDAPFEASPDIFDSLTSPGAARPGPHARGAGEVRTETSSRPGPPSSTNTPSLNLSWPDLVEIADVAPNLQSHQPGTVASLASGRETQQQSPASLGADDLIPPPGRIGPLETSTLEDRRTSPLLEGHAQRTEFGGFFFLLPVLSRLGIASFLKTNPHLIELDFAAHLLRFLAAQLKIPVSDPLMTALPKPAESLPRMTQFSVPTFWRERLYKSGNLILSRIEAAPGRRTLSDRSGRITLANWKGPTPQAVRQLIGDGRIKRRTSSETEDITHPLMNTWYSAMRRWCRACAGLKLDELINRRALITFTRTHTDLFFDLRQVDIRVRRAGLDLDPAWVAWLGQVVSFHYLEEGEIDGL